MRLALGLVLVGMTLLPRPDQAVAAASGVSQEVTTAMLAHHDAPPRKVVIGTSLYSMWTPYPGLEARLNRLAEFVDQMAAQARWKYGAGLDLAVLPEVAVTGEAGANVADRAVPLEGPVLEVMGAAARRNHTYLVVPTYLAENADHSVCSNAAVLLDREGKVVGIYRKVYVVADAATGKLEGGCIAGKDFPVFTCDFGKLGLQICFDMEFDAGWKTLGRKGAELVAWTSQSPQMLQPRRRAIENGYYVVSSTWRNNASVFDPTGDIVAQTREEPAGILVTQIDLSYVILPWQTKLQSGKALSEKYGEAVGFRYSESEDRGIFWSNDPQRPIGQMVRELGLETLSEELARSVRTQDAVRGGPPSTE
jgi:predicted amidohydrolase